MYFINKLTFIKNILKFFIQFYLFLFILFFWLRCTACGILFPDQGSNPCPLHWELGVLTTGPSGKSLLYNFKGYFPFTVITKYWLFSPCCTIHPLAYLTPSSLCLPLPNPWVAPPLIPTGNHYFVLYICESASFLLYSLVCCIFLDSTYKWYHMVFVFLFLTYFT